VRYCNDGIWRLDHHALDPEHMFFAIGMAQSSDGLPWIKPGSCSVRGMA
jgi:hypothetical protein